MGGNIVKGSLFAISAFFCMALFGILTKEALEGGSVFWVSFIAYLAGTVALMPYVGSQGFAYLKSNHYSFLVGRAVLGTLASLCYTLAIHYIPIVNGTLLFNTAPLFIPLIASTVLKERVAKSTWLAVLLGFIGVIFIIKPTEALFTQGGNLIGILSGLSLAAAYLLMKLLTATDPGPRIIFYYLGLGMLLQIPLLFLTPSLPTPPAVLYSILAGLLLLVAQLGLIQSYRYASASQVGIYQYTSVVFVGLLGWALWGTLPTAGDLIGILLVTLAGVIIIRNFNHK